MTDTTRRDAIARSICARVCRADRTEDELRVVDDVLAGLEKGAETMGPLDLANDTRDWNEEASQECRDLLAYLAMERVAEQHRRRERLTASDAGADAVTVPRPPIDLAGHDACECFFCQRFRSAQ